MEAYSLKTSDVKFHNIVIAVTSEPDYNMDRWLLLEDLEDLKYGEYVVVEGGHCSCYGFDDTQWSAMRYSKEELIKLAELRASEKCWYKEEKEFYKLVIDYLRR